MADFYGISGPTIFGVGPASSSAANSNFRAAIAAKRGPKISGGVNPSLFGVPFAAI